MKRTVEHRLKIMAAKVWREAYALENRKGYGYKHSIEAAEAAVESFRKTIGTK